MKKQIEKKTNRKITTLLKGSQNYTLFIITLFIATVLIGIIGADNLEELISPLLESILARTENLNTIELIFFIFINNALTSIAGILGGVFLGILPIITTITNGLILGYVLERTAQISILEMWRIFPHGIFELPAVFISLGLGLKLGLEPIINYLKYYRKKQRILCLLPFLIAIPLIIMAIILAQNTNLLENQELPKSLSILLFPISAIIFYMGLTLIIFILATGIKDIRLRRLQLNSLKLNLQNSIKIFFYLVIPLLIIAAIIEGLLIAFL